MTASECLFCHQLAAPDALPGADVVWQFPHSVALLGPWQYYQGYCLLIARIHAVELYQLSPNERRAYLEEMCLLAEAIADCFQPHKLNYELLGNQVPHLHWHLFPRSRSDPDAQHPVWLALNRAEHNEAERRRLQMGSLDRPTIVAALRNRLHARSAPQA